MMKVKNQIKSFPLQIVSHKMNNILRSQTHDYDMVENGL